MVGRFTPPLLTFGIFREIQIPVINDYPQLVPVSTEGRVEHQNEPKQPQSGDRLGSFWCSTRPSADAGTDYNLHYTV